MSSGTQDAFSYRGGELYAEDVPLARIAETAVTPVYVYSTAAIEAAYRDFAEAFAGRPAGIFFALKANSNLAVVRTLAALGAGADVVSAGELQQALAAGVPPAKIVFSGVGKTMDEIAAAIEAGILQINVESAAEIEDVAAVAGRMGRRAPVALRVNPDIAADTHAKIATGRSENKFGIDLDHAAEAYARAAALEQVEIHGLAVHIGSQITDLAPFRSAFARVAELVMALRSEGHRVERLDLGGGLGIDYRGETPPATADYAALIEEVVGSLGCELALEPGRCLVANAGVLLTRVIRIKEGVTHRFVIVDAGMNDLLRPALYDAYHAITPVAEPAADAPRIPVEVVGPICETADTFARERPLPPLRAGDLLAIRGAGAYGAVMASAYNTRPPAAEAMVRGGESAVIRARADVASLIARDRLPPWLASPSRPARVREA